MSESTLAALPLSAMANDQPLVLYSPLASSQVTATRFACPINGCTESYPLKKTLNRHIRSKHGSGPLKCTYPGCIQRFARPDLRKRHIDQFHTENKQLAQCALCGGREISSRSFAEHVKTKRHRAAQEQLARVGREQDVGTMTSPMCSESLINIEASDDLLLLASWLLYKKILFKGYKNLDLQQAMGPPSLEAMELGSLEAKTLSTFSSSLQYWDQVPLEQLARCIMIMALVSFMQSGIEHLSMHERGLQATLIVDLCRDPHASMNIEFVLKHRDDNYLAGILHPLVGSALHRISTAEQGAALRLFSRAVALRMLQWLYFGPEKAPSIERATVSP